MQRFEAKTFWHQGESLSVADIEASKCEFNQCFVREDTQTETRFRNVTLTDCSHWNCSISGAVLDGVRVHNLKKVGASPLFLNGCLFNHVALSGKIAGIKINRYPVAGVPANRAIWDSRAVSFYQKVDWALDISEAKFPAGVTFEAIPGDLIKRNPATQVLIKRGALQTKRWRDLDFQGTAIDIAISWFEADALFDSVAVVARNDPKYAARDLDVLAMLRAEGVAEPD